MAVDPISISSGVANITSALPIVQDALTYGGNWVVSNTVGAVMVAMTLVGFGVGLIVKMIRGRRGRR